jgi:asparagine synthase (glutamine-hydrolysing)
METLFEPNDLLIGVSPLLRSRWQAISRTLTEKILDTAPPASRLRALMHFRMKFSLAEDMLPKVDRMSMAASLEVRAPLLSAEVTDLARRLPDRHLLRNGVRKYLLREVGRKWLPPDLYSRPKTGFTIPLHSFRNGRFAAMCMDYVANGRGSIVKELFTPAALQTVLARGLEDRFNEGTISVHRAMHQNWALLQLGMWADRYSVSL